MISNCVCLFWSGRLDESGHNVNCSDGNLGRSNDHEIIRLREQTVGEMRIIAETAVALLREGMESTGSSTLHYQKMSGAVEILSQIVPTVKEFETAT